MYLNIEDNPNCSAEERVFAAHGPSKKVGKVHVEHGSGGHQWCDVVGIDEEGAITEATAQQVDDSADGIAWLITGGTWGLRFRPEGHTEEWDLKNKNQWGVPFLVLDQSGSAIQFKTI